MIAIAGGKGGCGKTTTTLGVARALAARGVRTRAADLDRGMPNLHRLAGVERDPTLADVAADPGTYQRDAHGVEVLPAPRVTAPVDLADALDVLELSAAVTLLDCPAGAGPDAVVPLQAASAVVLVSTDRPESVEDAAKTGRMARSLDVPVLGAVVTRTDSLSERARDALPTDHVIAVPDVDDPLTAPAVRDCYDVVAQWLVGEEPAREGRVARAVGQRGRDDNHASTATRDGVSASAARRDDDHASAAGRDHRHAGAAGRERAATRRRGRRSRRSRDAAGTRSSSRGGGAPSDRT